MFFRCKALRQLLLNMFESNKNIVLENVYCYLGCEQGLPGREIRPALNTQMFVLSAVFSKSEAM